MKTKETLVSITRVSHSIESSVKSAIRLVGGMDSVVSRGDEVFLKPNFVAPRHSSRGVTTNFEIIRVVAEEVRRCGGTPVLFETPAIEFEKETVYEVLGVRDFAKQNRIRLVDGAVDLIDVPVSGGRVLRSLKIPRMLYQAKIINLPKLKTHVSAKVTCGLKNMIGLLPNSEKRRVHIRGVHASIADIHKVLRPVLTVVDAITCLEGDGPTYGDKVDLGLIISGKNAASIDKVCSQIIGLPWEEVKYLRLADGEVSTDELKVIGESLREVRASLRIPRKGAVFHGLLKMIYLLDVLFSKVSTQHLNGFLYSTGFVGTNPKIVPEKCNRCGDCVKACPVNGALNIEKYRVNYKACIRCLDCYFACEHQAIMVKGFSRPERH
jgi:uncharacterized protein (DUF362 family)/NAD-dependent dihydropyrimidine dehydrogenase PreA subunit